MLSVEPLQRKTEGDAPEYSNRLIVRLPLMEYDRIVSVFPSVFSLHNHMNRQNKKAK